MAYIIDSHVHLYPREVSDDPGLWAASRSEAHWGRLVLPGPSHPTLQGWADVDDLLREMDRAAVDRAVLQGWYWRHQDTCNWHNSYYERCVKMHPDRLSAFATVCPSSGAGALETIRRAREKGFLGLGELCPAIQGGALRDDTWVAAMELAAENDLMVLFHCDEQMGRPHPGRVKTPAVDFQWILETCPGLRIILAHFGGGVIFHCLNRGVVKLVDRIWFDTAASPLLYSPAVYASAVACGAGDRLLFGSDFPLITFPGKSGQPDLVSPLEELRGSGLTEFQLNRILGKNAANLLGL